MSGEWTLPYVQERLDALRPGQDFSLSREDMSRLFGFNDVAVSRIQGFAGSHGCFPIYFAGGVLFRKENDAARRARATSLQRSQRDIAV